MGALRARRVGQTRNGESKDDTFRAKLYAVMKEANRNEMTLNDRTF